MTRKQSIATTLMLFLVLTITTLTPVRAQAFDYSLSISPSNSAVFPGESITANLTATLISSGGQPVNFTFAGLPAGVSASLTPNTYCVPTCSLNLTFAADSTATLGTFGITIAGNETTPTPSDDTVTFSLTVTKTRIVIEPPTVIDVPTGGKFGFNVTVKDVSNLFGFQVNVTYNPAVIILSDVAVGPYYANLAATGCGFRVIQRNETQGWFSAAATQFGTGCPGSVNGSIELVVGNFTVNSLGETVIKISTKEKETILSDPGSIPIPYSKTQDGFFSNLGLTRTHDLRVTVFVVDPTDVFANKVVQVTVVSKNQGNVAESFDVKATANTTQIDSSRITGLAPGASQTVAYSWNTTGAQAGKYTVKVELTLDPGLVDETPENNVRVQPLTVRVFSVAQGPSEQADTTPYIIAAVGAGAVILVTASYVYFSRRRIRETA